jgi:hypothetical protein
MYEIPVLTMSKEEALIYISKLKENQRVKIIVLSNEAKRGDKQLLTENEKWDYGCYKD